MAVSWHIDWGDPNHLRYVLEWPSKWARLRKVVWGTTKKLPPFWEVKKVSFWGGGNFGICLPTPVSQKKQLITSWRRWNFLSPHTSWPSQASLVHLVPEKKTTATTANRNQNSNQASAPEAPVAMVAPEMLAEMAGLDRFGVVSWLGNLWILWIIHSMSG